MTPQTASGALPRVGRRILSWLDEHRAGLASAAVALVVFVVALAWSLPHDLIARRALETATVGGPVGVDFQSVAFAFPNGYRFTGLRLTPQQKPDAVVAIDELTVRAPLLSLLAGDPRKLDLSGRAYGGTLEGHAALRGSAGGALDLRLGEIDLGRALAPFLDPPGSVEGRATLDLRLSGDGRTTQSADGDLDLSVTGLAVHQLAARGFPIPDARFAQADLTAQIAGPKVTVKQFAASGDELNLVASGDVTLRDPVVQSLLNLRLGVDVAAQAPPPIRVLTALLPRRAAGEASNYTLGGTIAAPSLR
jgi:type II secretion system protein N